MEYLVTIPTALVSTLERAVVDYNASREGETPEVDEAGLLQLWLAPRVAQLASMATEREWHEFKKTYGSASAEDKAEVDAILKKDVRRVS